MPGELPEVTLEPAERERLAHFFRNHAANILAYNELVAQVETLKAKELQRRDALKRLKDKTDRAYDDIVDGVSLVNEEGEVYQSPVHLPGRRRYPRVR